VFDVPHQASPVGEHRSMANRQEPSYRRSESTKWAWKKVRLPGGPAPAGDSRSAAATASPLRRRDAHKPLTIVVRYHGGSCASWVIQYRGRSYRFEGHLALHDVLSSLSKASWEARGVS
jgi:hypothetical protein